LIAHASDRKFSRQPQRNEMTIWVHPFRSVMRAKAKLGHLQAQLHGLEAQLHGFEAQLHGFEAQLHGFEQTVANVETRLTRLEQLVGFGDAGENEPTVTPIGKLLDARLTHLEARLLTYLEGPYFARIAKLRSDDAPPTGRDPG